MWHCTEVVNAMYRCGTLLTRTEVVHVPKWSKFRICRKSCTEVVCTEMIMYRSGPSPGANMSTIFGMPVPEICEGNKRPNFGAISDNFRLWSRMSPDRIDISKMKKTWSPKMTFHSDLRRLAASCRARSALCSALCPILLVLFLLPFSVNSRGVARNLFWEV